LANVIAGRLPAITAGAANATAFVERQSLHAIPAETFSPDRASGLISFPSNGIANP
jgi:hypothetical protein